MSRVNPDAIPTELADRDQWICWRTECRDEECGTRTDPTTKECPECGKKTTKRPYQVNGRLASSTNPTTWGSLSDALDAHRDDTPDTDGVGFVFDPDGLIAGVDLDACRDPETGDVEEWATDIVDSLDSFTEVSPSGTGLHVYVFGFIPEGGNKTDYETGEVEMYDHARYFTVTGERMDGTPGTVQQRQDALKDIHRRVFGDDTTAAGKLEDFDPPDDIDGDFPLHGHPLKELRQADPVLDDLLSDPHPGNHDDTSDYDFKTCIRLLHLGYEPEDVHGIMRRHRNRGKLLEDRGNETYLERTIRKAKSRLSGNAKNPVIESDHGDSEKLCLWKLRQAAVAYGILPPDAFIERENEDGDTYLGFPGRDTYNRTLEALAENGIDHGRAAHARAATDGGAGAASAHPTDTNSIDGPGVDDIGPEHVYDVLDIDPSVPMRKINNNQIANAIETLLSARDDAYLKVLDNEDSKDQEIYSMDPDSMVWGPKGGQRLGQVSRSILGMHNSQGIQNELANALRTNPEGYWLIDRDELGPDDDLFPVENGLLNLKTREPREPEPDDYLLGRTPTAYDPNASIEGTRFEQFLMQAVSPADLDKLQEYAGYCLLHSGQPYKKALFLFGPTNSGKGTFIEVLTAILGQENVSSESLYSLLCTRWGYHSIYGAWLNVSNELTPGGLKNVEKFKTLTGGEDRVTAEDKGVSKYEFTVTQKFIFATNQFPEVEDADKAFFKRCLFVEFPNTVPDEKLDPDLVDTLKSERSAILNWMLDGLDRLRENSGTFSNERDYDAKREITRAFGSPIDQFAYRALDVTNDAEHVVDKKGLYSAFTRFCDYIEKDTPTQRAFTRRLKEQSGITDGKSRRVDPYGNRRDVYQGIQLEPDLFKTIQADLPAHSYEDDGDGGEQQRF